ncbi:hypothetical protein GQ55_6G181200 [Panicum hallii var. hallii]|uniref:Uncharacterized protein n=1 Tax=Panicum hallii var. hallii TaxID=1504633 RepID=A0A2T7D736_9POAL|nr:hypothetical protein GQ55_6G181200 [Panicum hallii var. hallii]
MPTRGSHASLLEYTHSMKTGAAIPSRLSTIQEKYVSVQSSQGR